MFGLGPIEMGFILVLAVLLFGKRLPEVGRSVGRSIVEFKKGMNGIDDQIKHSSHSTSGVGESPQVSVDEFEEATAPKFEPPTTEPQDESSKTAQT